MPRRLVQSVHDVREPDDSRVLWVESGTREQRIGFLRIRFLGSVRGRSDVEEVELLVAAIHSARLLARSSRMRVTACVPFIMSMPKTSATLRASKSLE